MVKRKNGDEVDEAESERDTAHWHSHHVDTFCDLCIEQIVVGNVREGTFTIDGWRTIAQRFKEETGSEYIHKQLRNKWDSLKADYKLWKDLKKDCSEFSWDSKRYTVAGTKEWWKEKIQANPKVKKFMGRGIDPELESKLERMFGAHVADSKGISAPSSSMLLLNCMSSQSTGTSDKRTLFGTRIRSRSNGTSGERIPFDSSIRSHSNDISDEGIPVGIPSQSIGTSNERVLFGIHSKSNCTSKERVPFSIRSPSNGTSNERAPFGIRSQSNGISNERATFDTRSHPIGTSHEWIQCGSSIREVIALLDRMTEVQRGGQLYMFAVRKLFMLEPKREVFAALLPNIRLQWLKEEAMDAGLNVE